MRREEYSEALENYKKHTGRKRAFIISLLIITAALVILSVNAGSSGMSPIDVIKAIFKLGDKRNSLIVWNIRMPRVLAAIIAGAGLSLSGLIMQNVLKNPMASPSTLGVSNAAVFGANFAIIVLGAGSFHSTHGEALTIMNPQLVTICAFAFSLISTILILALSGRKGFSSETVVLAGVALGALFTAGTTIVQYFAVDTQVAAAVFWTFGDLGRASYREDLIMIIIVALSSVYFLIHRWDYNAMSNGEEAAKSLGVHTERVRFISLLLASLICAVCVSFLGIIGFIGLVAPHMVKKVTGNDFRYLIPSSALAGCALLLFSDTLARSAIKGIALPVGAVTSLFGGPMFLWMLLRKKGGKRV